MRAAPARPPARLPRAGGCILPRPPTTRRRTSWPPRWPFPNHAGADVCAPGLGLCRRAGLGRPAPHRPPRPHTGRSGGTPLTPATPDRRVRRALPAAWPQMAIYLSMFALLASVYMPLKGRFCGGGACAVPHLPTAALLVLHPQHTQQAKFQPSLNGARLKNARRMPGIGRAVCMSLNNQCRLVLDESN